MGSTPRLAFRLYGQFRWPPTEKTAANATRPGAVEIYFDDDGKGEKSSVNAFLVWRPGRNEPDESNPPQVPGKDRNVFAVDLNAAFAGDGDVSLWIGAEKKDGSKLWFQGAFLFEQYELSGARPTVDLCWPLVEQCQFDKAGSNFYSRLIIGQPDNDNFRLELLLPTPFPQTSLVAGGSKNQQVFPFAALFSPRPKSIDKATKLDALVLGCTDRPPRPGSDSRRYYMVTKTPSERLGKFNFALNSQDSNYVAYEDAAKRNPADYWPTKNSLARNTLLDFALKRVGFDTRTASLARIAFATDDESDLSLRFGPRRLNDYRQDHGRSGSLVYRVAMTLSGTGRIGDIGWGLFEGKLRCLLPLDTELGGVLHIASTAETKTIAIDLTMTWSIKSVWGEDRTAAWDRRIAVRLLWSETIVGGDLGAPLDSEGDSKSIHYRRGGLVNAASTMNDVGADVAQVDAAAPYSTLPKIETDKDKDATVGFVLSTPAGRMAFDANGLPDNATRIASSPVSWPSIRPSMRLTLASGIENRVKPDDGKATVVDALAANAEFRSMFGAGLNVPLKIAPQPGWIEGIDSFDEDDTRYFAAFDIQPDGEASGADWRIGGLLFSADKIGVHAQGHVKNELRCGGPGVRVNGRTPAAYFGSSPTAVDLRLAFSVQSVTPHGVDVARSDGSARPAPILIPFPVSPATVSASSQDVAAADKAEASYVLKTVETVAPTGNRALTAQLFAPVAGGGERDYVVLSAEPFSIVKLTETALGARADEGSAAVASYDSIDQLWTFRRVVDRYRYTFPPQAIGESADKPRRLEIFDAPKDAAKDAPVRPFDSDPYKPEMGVAAWGNLHRRAIEFRLTPSTEVWIEPSDVQRSFVTPAWDAYQLFRQHGELGLGAGLAAIRGEFLYGMSVSVDVSRERGVARRARVAEIEALTGSVVSAPRNEEAGASLSVSWNHFAGAVARRPERLEIWADNPASIVAFAPARFADGVSFAFRETALFRAPVEGPDAEFEKPDDEGQLRGKPTDGPIRLHPQGLSGGALWPVESANLLRILLGAPESNGGSIEQIALSPLGGDATQKAQFLNRIVSIISKTRNGFVERQQVEVLGRIGALWHRAKHVVVYERTVNPTAQFAPRYNDDPNRRRSRRPILRKVSEYVELLEPERSYPDFAEAQQRHAGFLNSVRFNSRIINVDSAWSRDVGKFGWEIPLWDRAAARERPQVYPMPDVAFVTAAEGDGDNPLAAQECRDPEKVYFFADFSAKTDDTNLWPARTGVDLANLPSAANLAEIVDVESEQELPDDRNRRKSVRRVLPGANRFTWRLAPASRKTMLNAGRSAKPVYVGVDSVTFMRSTQKASELHKDLRGAMEAAGAQNAKDWPSPDYWPRSGTGPSAGKFDAGKYKGLIEKLLDKTQATDFAKNTSDVNDLVSNLKDAFANDAVKIRTAAGKVNGAFAKAGQFIGDAEKTCAKLKSDALSTLKGKNALVVEHIRGWQHDATGIVGVELPKWAGKPKNALIEALAKAILAAIQPIFDETSADIGHVRKDVETARAVLMDMDHEIDALFKRAVSRVYEAAAGYDRGKPWSEARRKGFQEAISAAIDNVKDDIEGEIDEARRRLGVELGNAGQAIAGHVAQALRKIDVDKGDALAALKEMNTTAQLGLDRFTKGVNALVSKADGGAGRLDDAPKKIADAREKLKNAPVPAKDAANKMLDAADAAVPRVVAAALDGRNAAANLKANINLGTERLGAALDDLAKRANGARANLNAIVADALAQTRLLAEAGAADAKAALDDVADDLKAAVAGVETHLKSIADAADLMVAGVVDELTRVLNEINDGFEAPLKTLETVADDAGAALAGMQQALAPGQLADVVLNASVLLPVLEALLAPVPDTLPDVVDTKRFEAARAVILDNLSRVADECAKAVDGLTVEAIGVVGQIESLCRLAGESAHDVIDYFDGLADNVGKFIDRKAAEAISALQGAYNRYFHSGEKEIEAFIASVKSFDAAVRGVHNDIARSFDTAQLYGDRVMDAFSKIDVAGNPLAAPSNILKLYSAVTGAPEIAALKADIDRLRSHFDDASEIIKTTRASALFNHLGDELKALGLSLPFDGIGDRILPVDLSSFDISKVFSNFGGVNFKKLFGDLKLPSGVADAVRVTHDFDKAQARAWVQVDVDAPMPGRRTLFSLEVFQADFVDMRLTGMVRLEASKDSGRVTETGQGRVVADLDIVAGGQSIVTFLGVGMHFTRESGLKVDFDPSRVRLNPSFKFIQDFLSTLFPDEVGGLKVIKQNGIPVGLSHEFSMPPISLMFGTSGVSNISISNSFKLLAYPEFVLSDTFGLSRPEMPFIFSIFIIGGSGYIQMEAQYRPFDNELTVIIEAAAGGSATLGFAFGPIAGSVFISLSGAISYRRAIGRPGGGLTISAVLVISGNVSVCGLVTVGIYLLLRMSYRDNGQVDADGELSVTIRISKFFKISARANAHYKLRGGRSESSVSASTNGEVTDKRVQKAIDTVESLKKARG